MKVKIKYLRDGDGEKAGKEILMDREAAEMYLKEGNGLIEILKEETPKEESERLKKDYEENKREYLFEEFSEKTDFLQIVEKFMEVQPIYYDEGQVWWFWNWKNRCWNRKDEIDLLNAIDNFTHFPSVNSWIKSSLLEAFKRIGRRNCPQKIKKTWIQFKSDFYDAETGECIPSSPKYFSTNPIPWRVGESEDTPNIDSLFEQWVGKDSALSLYEIIAYCCLADYPIHRLFCFIGDGLNGKGSFLRLLSKFIGEENCCSTELDILLSSRFEVTRLYKRLVCLMGETNFNEMKQTSMLKKLTGGDLIGFEFKNKLPFEEYNYAKILIATNNLPTTTDKTAGFYRRWMIFDFPNTFNEKLDIISLVPEMEFENLAKKCLSILKELLKKREFHKEGSIEERAKKFEEKSNPFEKFWRDHIDDGDPQSDIPSWEFAKRINEWCRENKFRELSERTIADHLKQHQVQQVRLRKRWYENDRAIEKQVRCWAGIKWR